MLGRVLGMLIVVGAVALLGVGALNFISGPEPGPATGPSPSPTLVGVASPSPAPSPTAPPATPRSTPTAAVSPTVEPTPGATPFELTIEDGPGNIVFGMGRGENLTVRQPDTTFELGQRLFYVARLTETTPTDAITIEVSKYDVAAGSETPVTQLDVNARIPRIHTIRQRLDTSSLDGPGIYVMRFSRGDNALAEGWFEVTEP